MSRTEPRRYRDSDRMCRRVRLRRPQARRQAVVTRAGFRQNEAPARAKSVSRLSHVSTPRQDEQRSSSTRARAGVTDPQRAVWSRRLM